MKRILLSYFMIAVCTILVISCSNSSELRFLGESLDVPCEEFEKHLEKNGFKHDYGPTYKGEYLGKEVIIILSNENNGHYTQMTLMLVSTEISKSKIYYEKLCEEIEKEHSGFKKKDHEKDDAISYTQQSTGDYVSMPTNEQILDFYNGAGKRISISYYGAPIMATITATFESED